MRSTVPARTKPGHRHAAGKDGSDASADAAPDRLHALFEQAAQALARLGLTRLSDGLEAARANAGSADARTFRDLAEALRDPAVAPADCLLAAAGAGLFPSHQPPADRSGNAARNAYLLRHLEHRDFRVRVARADDLPDLVALERRCWRRPLRTRKKVLRQRVARYPEGQFVLLAEGAVAGVVYSQRIAGAAALDGLTAAEVDALHDPDAATVQLLAINIEPEMQNRALGDQLLEFALTLRSLQPEVAGVVAVTLCRGFDAGRHPPLADYIRLRNGHGVLADPILRFHELHGAAIDRLVPGYRPADLANQGCGVLVRYDIRSRRRKALNAEGGGGEGARAVRLPRVKVLAEVKAAVLACLREAGPAAFAFDRPLMEMGLNSADILELSEALSQRFRRSLPPSFFFQYNTAERIAGHLCERPAAPAPAPAAETPAAPATAAAAPAVPAGLVPERDVAIVGMACRLPGGIDSPDALWACLRDGACVIGALPDGRWRWPDGIDPAGAQRGIDRGGFLDDVAAFDAPFFRVSPAEAASMDPQQRILLELCWQAVEHAGHAPDRLAGSRTGVFIGASGSDYARLLDQCGQPVEAHYGTGGSMAVLANRISYVLDLRGPSLLIDTACSASLVAVHEAVRAIRDGEADQALVGGVNLILHPSTSIAYHKAGMLSPDGLCRSFDQDANGYVRGEGAVVMLLKPLRAALADGDRVHAVIKGTASAHGGQASGLTVPNPERQGRLLASAWRAAGIDARALTYIEAHGTGTRLGDPIEVQGIRQAFAEATGDAVPPRCGLGSVKTNLGHLEAAAGLAGLLKVVLSLRHRTLPALLHLRQPNAQLGLEPDADGGLYLVDRAREWAPPAGGGARLAGVSSFGSGGTNAHVVVAEPPADMVAEPPADVAAQGPVLFVLSARTPERLRAYARRVADWLESGAGATVALDDLARQFQTGRTAMEERLALVVTSRADLIAGLTNAGAAPPAPADAGHPSGRSSGRGDAGLGELVSGEAGRTFLRTLVAQGDLEGVAALWRAGADIDWTVLHGDAARGRGIEAPTYPFARHRYWVPGADMAPAQPADSGARTQAPPLALAPVWSPVSTPAAPAFPGAADAVLVIGTGVGADAARRSGWAAALPAARWLDLDPGATIEGLRERIAAFGPLDHVVWLAPDAVEGETLLERQRGGLLFLFRLVKALLALGHGDRALGLTLVTRGTQAVHGARVDDPAHAGVHGFAGALANEQPRWLVRSLDLESGLESGPDCPVAEMLAQPANRGEPAAWRDGRWHRRALGPVAALPDAPPAYRQGGVYVVIGGAGGVGAAWTRHAIEQAGAQVVWIGRRPPDEAIEARIAELAHPGPAPVYIAADAADSDSLRAAHAEIRRRWPAVHGVIHAAVGVFDRGVAEMDEAHFRAVLSSKVEAAVHVAEVFGGEPLDFLLHFSSIVALEKNGGLSGYAAGGAFADALALHLNGRRPYPVKTINWGHWEIGTGATISDAARTRLLRGGGAPLQPGEALAALDRFLAAPLARMALVKTARPEALPLHDATRVLSLDTGGTDALTLPEALDGFAARVPALQPVSLFNNVALEAALAPLFAATLRALGLAAEAEAGADGAGLPGFYGRWLRAGRELLAARGGIGDSADPALDLDGAWRAWEEAKRRDLAAPDLAAAVELAEACLRGLPDVLAGRVRATDILFPDSSMRRVEGIYRGNAVADAFNGLLADALVAAVAERCRRDPAARLRILEVGAGTGGTTATVLPRLAPHRDHIAEYAYTDLSKAFLFHAEERFVADHPYVRPLLFDVEKPIAGQAVAAHGYDLVIATNVLHATRDIRRTLATCKAALRRGGLLLLNEIGTRSLFAHVTFGLLEGWWLAEDQPLRLPDSPGLSPRAWRRVLTEEGFAPVHFPAPESHALGQQVIVARSDGAVWQAVAAGTGAKPAPSAAPVAAGPAAESPKAAANRLVGALVARTLRMDPADIDPLEPLETYGIDSILVVQITNALRERFPDVSSTLLFECQTVDALSDHFVRTAPEALAAAGPAPAAAPVRSAAPDRPDRPVGVGAGDAIAVIGMSCRFPRAGDADEYWRLLASGGDAVREVPAERWPLDGFYHPDPDEAVARGKSYAKWGGFLEGVTEFDPLFFNIAPKEAAAIDPQERLFLQTAWAALEDAGYTRDRLARDFRRQLGVFVGITRTGFDLFGPPLWRRGDTVYPHTSFSSAANRLSWFLNARGPSVPVDTMCSSSLTAIHQACQSLRGGECELAIAGGVNVYLHPSGYVGLSAARMLSPDGVCRSFGKGGNGFVPGEGVAALLLKPLSRAEADGDHIHAVIRATHVNHGGKTNGYTVPNPLAQADLVRDALLKAGVDARAVSCIEAHGTGTELGDPIEVAGLTQAFRHFTPDNGFCALGSAKSNIGHLEAAAGIAGVIKVILQMRHGKLAPSLHADEPNPNIDFPATPFVVQRTLADWVPPTLPDGTTAPRIAGVSSFGAGGANAHVVLEEYPQPPAAVAGAGDAAFPIVLSARTAERLAAYAGRLADVLDRRLGEGDAPGLADLAYTLQVGREAMEQRLALSVRTLEELRDRLRAFAGGAGSAGLHTANTRDHKRDLAALTGDAALPATVERWFREGRHDQLLDLWVKGPPVDWEALHRAAAGPRPMPRRVGLPTYAFATTPYWLPVVGSEVEAMAVPAPAPVSAPRAQPMRVADPAPAPAAVPPAKPSAIVLRDAASVSSRFAAPAGLPCVTLCSLEPAPAALLEPASVPESVPEPAAGALAVRDHGDGVLSIAPDMADGAPVSGSAAALAEALAWIGARARDAVRPTAEPAVRAVVLEGVERLLPGDDLGGPGDAAAALARCAVPVIAALDPAAGGAARRLADTCDMTAAKGEDALAVARDVARAPAATLSELKARLPRAEGEGTAPTEPLDSGFAWSGQAPELGAGRRVPLASDVVTLDAYANGVVVVTLCERAGKNTFTPAFVAGVLDAFAHIAATPDYKAVVLTGFDHYFACGGTREGLLAIQSGKARFTDEQSYAQPLACDIPVIAAMQGHAIGAGWAMGLFCDWAVYSEESVYQSPYMLYGFTPGAGSTLIFPQRLGDALAREILFTARAFPGRELKRRGIAMPVLPRAEVLGYALALASHLAAAERAELVRRKAERCAWLRGRLPAAFARELAMHDRTFVGNAAVVAGIDRHFNGGEIAVADTPAVHPAPRARAADAASAASLRAALRRSLADELLATPDQIADDVAFIDLGMDSISAVTWIRKVNARYGLSLPATSVYSHPDLTRFTEQVLALTNTSSAAAPATAVPPAGTVPANDAGPTLEWLRRTLAVELGAGEEVLDEDTRFIDLGLDSVTAVTWIRGINARHGLSIPATTVYSHPTLAEFHRHLLTLAGERAEAPTTTAEAPLQAETPPPAEPADAPPVLRTFPLAAPPSPLSAAATPAVAPAPSTPAPATPAKAPPAIAIIGMAGQFPMAADVDQFWRNLVAGRDCVSEIPATRWPVDAYYDPDRAAPGKTVCKWMGVLDDIDVFDPLFFNIAPSEAELMDPQQRLFLQNAWRCIEDAGYDPAALSGSACGVFVGCQTGDYGQWLAGQPHSAQALMGESMAMLPARVAYYLNLQGPCLAIDTACSASLVALANACDSLVLGGSDLALAGGVCVLTGPEIHVRMSKAGMLSPTGRCHSFDQRADGFVPGEGVGVVLLKRLEDAERDGDDIHAVIRGWGVNQDGRTNGITAPNQQSQTRLETGVYQRFGIDPADIGLVEAHGTGTKLGDPIEVEALCGAFRRFTDRRHFCALGSVKSNIGHLATAAGITGIIKGALALRHRHLPPTINHDTLNEHIDLSGSPFYVNTRGQPWAVEPGRRRLVAVSSFGFSGTNAHVVLEEAVRPDPVTAAATGAVPVLVPLSARGAGPLARLARGFQDHLAGAAGAAASLADLAYTCQTGRAAMPHRLAIVAATVEELRAALADFAATGAAGESYWTGVAGKPAASVPPVVPADAATRHDLAALAQRWVAGERIDWTALPRPGGARRRHGLPTYPFESERYWAPRPEADATAPVPVESPSPPSPTIDTAPWFDAALPEAIDWRARLRHRLGQRVLVIGADDALIAAFRRLLDQLARAGGLAAAPLTVRAPGDALMGVEADCLLYLGGRTPGEPAAVLAALAQVPTALVHLHGDLAAAERFGAGLAARRGATLLLSQPDGGDADAVAQILVREWLAFGAEGAEAGLTEVHHDGTRRRRREPRPGGAAAPIHRIVKTWQAKAARPAGRPSPRGTVLLLVNPDSLRIAGTLFAPGDFRAVVLAGGPGLPPGEGRHAVDFTDPHVARLAAHTLMESEGDITHVVDLLDLHEAPRDHDGDPSGRAVFYQALIGGGDVLAILHLTRGLQPFRGDGPDSDGPTLAGARIAGLIRMLSADYRHVDARSLDLDRAACDDPARLRRLLLEEFASTVEETELCVRDGQRFAPRLTAEVTEETAPPPLAADGVYAVSGGTNGVGLELARHLVARGCRRLVLMGVTPLPPRAAWADALADETLPPYVRAKLPALIALERAVDRLEIHTGPLTDAAALARRFQEVRATLGPIRGVIHAAGVYSDPATPGFAGKPLCAMRRVWEAKADGLETLFALVRDDPPDFFVTLGSMTGLVPHLARGAADYAMANAFAGAFIAHQRRTGADWARTIVWSDWNETGAITRVAPAMAATVTETFERIGLRTFTNREGRALFDRALACGGDATVTVGYLDAERFARAAPRLLHADPDAAKASAAPIAMTPAALLPAHLERWEAERRAGRPVPVERVTGVIGLDEIRRLDPALILRIHAVLFGAQPEPEPDSGMPVGPGPEPDAEPDAELEVDIARIISGTVMEVLKLKTLDRVEPFQNYGLDSISAMVLATRLEKKLKQPIQPQWLIDFPTVDTLSGHLTTDRGTA